MIALVESVLYASTSTYDELKKTEKLQMKNCHRKLWVATSLTTEVNFVINVPMKVGLNKYEFHLCVSVKLKTNLLARSRFFQEIQVTSCFLYGKQISTQTISFLGLKNILTKPTTRCFAVLR